MIIPAKNIFIFEFQTKECLGAWIPWSVSGRQFVYHLWAATRRTVPRFIYSIYSIF